jgi:site-specific DNA-methyltransferase (adenine-specific)
MVYIDLYQGDCLEVMKDLSSNSIDCFICDLPYGCLTTPLAATAPGWRKEVEAGLPKTLLRGEGCSWDVKINLEEFWKQVKRLCKNDHTPILMFATTKFGYELIKSNESWFRYDLVWDKQRGVSFLNANKMPMRSHEMIYVFSKSGAFYNRIDEKGEPYNKKNTSGNCYKNYKEVETINEGTRCVKSVIQLPKVIRAKQHPTEKPIELYKWLIERYCPPGGTILDPTAGSFNSCFACYELDRNSIGIEKDTEFYKKACEKSEVL